MYWWRFWHGHSPWVGRGKLSTPLQVRFRALSPVPLRLCALLERAHGEQLGPRVTELPSTAGPSLRAHVGAAAQRCALLQLQGGAGGQREPAESGGGEVPEQLGRYDMYITVYHATNSISYLFMFFRYHIGIYMYIVYILYVLHTL